MHIIQGALLLFQLLSFKISKNYCHSPESRVADEENMNLSNFLKALGDQGEFPSGKHCMPKWTLGSTVKSTGFGAFSTWPPPKK